VIPALPDCLPRRGNAFSRTASRWLLAAAGWRIQGEIPPRAKMVAIVAPHTSNWDFIVGVLAMFAIGIRVRFLGKHTLFNFWLGWLMRWLGGTPVVRETPQGAVAKAVSVIESEPAVVLALAPEGTRTAGGAPWRSGFYRIAHAARVPILPVVLDGGRRAVRLLAPLEPSGDYEADVARLQALYADVRGLRP
jgi:1-acyl-sn-glycerol-3-phosphate acyltransferase